MRLIDLHTHHRDNDGNLFILSCTDGRNVEEKNISVGLHPWNIDAECEQKMQEIGKILHSYAIIEEKTSFAGAVEGAVNKELESTGVSCRDIHIKRTGY